MNQFIIHQDFYKISKFYNLLKNDLVFFTKIYYNLLKNKLNMRKILKIKREDNNFIFILNGEIVFQNEEEIKKEIIDTLQKDSDYQNVYIDMRNVTFLDSSGIGMFIYINKFLHSQQKVLHLISPPPNVLKMLELGAFDRLFKIEE